MSHSLFQAIEANDFEALKTLLESGADPNARDSEGAPALIRAADTGNIALIQPLLNSCADIDCEWSGSSILDFIISSRNPDALRFLLDQKPRWDPSALGETLHSVSQLVDEPEECIAMVQILLERGANVDERDYSGCTALIYASVKCKVEVVELLLNAGADPNAQDNDQETVLMWAADGGNVPIIERLLKAGAAINAQSDSGTTPLYWAVRMGHVPAVIALLEAGASLNAPQILSSALHSKRLKILRILIGRGVDLNQPLDNGLSALETARKYGRGDVVRMLKQFGAR